MASDELINPELHVLSPASRPKTQNRSTFLSHTLKNKGSRCHRITFLSKWFHKEPLTSEEPFCFTKGSLW